MEMKGTEEGVRRERAEYVCVRAPYGGRKESTNCPYFQQLEGLGNAKCEKRGGR